MKAFPFDAENPLGGDHTWYVGDDHVEYNEGDTFEKLETEVNAEQYADWLGEDWEQVIRDDPEAIEDAYLEKIAGFWIVTDETYETAKLVFPEHIGRDGVLYQANHSAKCILKERAVKIITAS